MCVFYLICVAFRCFISSIQTAFQGGVSLVRSPGTCSYCMLDREGMTFTMSNKSRGIVNQSSLYGQNCQLTRWFNHYQKGISAAISDSTDQKSSESMCFWARKCLLEAGPIRYHKFGAETPGHKISRIQARINHLKFREWAD